MQYYGKVNLNIIKNYVDVNFVFCFVFFSFRVLRFGPAIRLKMCVLEHMKGCRVDTAIVFYAVLLLLVRQRGMFSHRIDQNYMLLIEIH